jgi:hypothetical protein
VVEEMNFQHQFNESVVYKDANLGLVENEHKSFYRYKCHHLILKTSNSKQEKFNNYEDMYNNKFKKWL